jgi:hypothetical protein
MLQGLPETNPVLSTIIQTGSRFGRAAFDSTSLRQGSPERSRRAQAKQSRNAIRTRPINLYS